MRWILTALAGYALAFFVAGQWAQTTLYAGCSIKTADIKYYVFPDGWFCLTRLPDMAEHLGVIGWPVVSAACFLTAMLCLPLGVITMERRDRSPLL